MNLSFCFLVLGLELRALWMLSKHSNTVLHPSLLMYILIQLKNVVSSLNNSFDYFLFLAYFYPNYRHIVGYDGVIVKLGMFDSL